MPSICPPLGPQPEQPHTKCQASAPLWAPSPHSHIQNAKHLPPSGPPARTATYKMPSICPPLGPQPTQPRTKCQASAPLWAPSPHKGAAEKPRTYLPDPHNLALHTQGATHLSLCPANTRTSDAPSLSDSPAPHTAAAAAAAASPPPSRRPCSRPPASAPAPPTAGSADGARRGELAAPAVAAPLRAQVGAGGCAGEAASLVFCQTQKMLRVVRGRLGCGRGRFVGFRQT
eukprot:362393-Chlamydomonas_euryale.AAC.2